jgi:predicted dehydrogenase
MSLPLNRPSRRKFLQTSAAAGIGYWVAGGVQAQESHSPNERIQFACIGIGGKGSSDSSDAKKHGQVIAICDIDQKKLEKAAAEKFVDAKTFFDYHELFDKMDDKIDAVTISTPDHHHGPAAALALRRKKHTFCQKPLTRSIYEARRLGELARENGVATQMGNQGTARAGMRKAAALVKAGVLGDVREVHVWTNRPVWPQGGSRPDPSTAPDHVKWDLFIGPAPMRPYAKGYHPFAWRGWWDFGSGALGDMACHTFNLPFQALNLRDPILVQAETSGHNKDSFPKWSVITFEFGPQADRGPVTFKWYDGGKRPSEESLGIEKLESSGTVIVGEKATLYSPDDYGSEFTILGEVEQPEVEIVQSQATSQNGSRQFGAARQPCRTSRT